MSDWWRDWWDFGGERMSVLARNMNPLTRRSVQLIPPIEIHSGDEYAEFSRWFQAQCLKAWKSEDWKAKDPKTMDCSGWRDVSDR
jgi:hypothetical protein